MRSQWIGLAFLAVGPLLGWGQSVAIEPLPYPFAALDWSTERSREEAEMWLRVSGLPQIDVRCGPLSFQRTIQGCGAQLACGPPEIPGRGGASLAVH